MIKLNGGYVIEPDTYGYTLGVPYMARSVDKKTGEAKEQRAWKNQTFHSTIGGALRTYRKLCQRAMIAEGEYTLATAMTALKELDAKIFEEARDIGFVPMKEGD